MAQNNNGRFVRCDHCDDNLAGLCNHCGGDHHGPVCPTLRGIQPFNREELEGIQERLSVTPGVMSDAEGIDSTPLIVQIVGDYREIQAALKARAGLPEWHDNDQGAALSVLHILYGSGDQE